MKYFLAIDQGGSKFISPLDQCGGALGTKAWQSILDDYTGFGEKTLLSQLILEKYNEPNLVELYKKFTTNQILFKNYELCPLLMEAAISNDKVALDILETSANRLVCYIEEGSKKLGLMQTLVTLVLTGGVFKGKGKVFFNIISRIVTEKN